MASTLPSSAREPAATLNTEDSRLSDTVSFEFEPFCLDPVNRLLSIAGKEVTLPGRAFDILLFLVQRPGQLVTKEELLSSIWGASFVEESNLTVTISTLRRALDEDPANRRYIQTVSRHGYRFIAEVREIKKQPRPAVVAPMPTAVGSELSNLDAPSGSANVQARPSVELPHLPAAGAQPRFSLRPMAAIVAALCFLLALGSWLLLKPREPIKSLAVLPFTLDRSSSNGSANTSDINDFTQLGMTDEMISRLNGEFVVRPTSSILRYLDANSVNPVSAGREQNVDAVLTGSIEKSSGTINLKLRLIRVRDGITLWQNHFQSSVNELSSLEQKSESATAHELHLLGTATNAAADAHAANSTLNHVNNPAYQDYLIGRYFWNRRTEEGLEKSADYFRMAINADPNFAPAYAGLADSYALMASFSVEPGKAANADARSAALSAIHIDPALAEPHASLGMIYFFTDWNLTAAQQEFEQAIRLNPNYATAHHWYALDLAAMDRPVQALYEIRLAQKLDPLSLIIGTNVGWIEYLARDYPDSLRDLHRVLELDPNFARARTRLGMVEMATGNFAAAVADLKQALVLSGVEDPWVEGLLGDAEAHAGNRAAAERVLTELQKRSASHYVPPISKALTLLGLGRETEAVASLSQAVDDHSTSMVYARVDPSLDPVRNDPVFQALLTHIK